MATGSMVRGLSCCAVGMNVPGGGAGGAAPPRPLRPTSQMIAATTTTLAAAMPSTESCRWVDQAYRREVSALESLLLFIYGAPPRCHLFKLQRTPRRRSGNRAISPHDDPRGSDPMVLIFLHAAPQVQGSEQPTRCGSVYRESKSASDT